MHWTCDPDFVGPYPPLADGRANGCYVQTAVPEKPAWMTGPLSFLPLNP